MDELQLNRSDFCGVVLSYGRVPRLPEVLDSLGDLPTFVFNPVRSWWSEEMKDRTLARLGSRRLTVVRNNWPKETSVRNNMVYTTSRAGFKIMIMLDADEVLQNLDGCIEEITQNTGKEIYTCRLVDFDKKGKILPSRSHRPAMAVDVRTIRDAFLDKRCVAGTLHHLLIPTIHHHSYDVPEENRFKQTAGYEDNWPPIEHQGRV